MDALNDTLKVIDTLHDADEVQQTSALIDKVIHRGYGDKPDVMWRHGRVLYLLGKEEVRDKKRREELVTKGYGEVTRCLAAPGQEETNYQAHKWAGIILSAVGEFKPTKEKIGNAFTIRNHFVKGLSIYSMDATLHHCLGSWCWNIMQISYLERKVAAVLFAAPPTSSYEECERHLMRSFELDPKAINNNLLLGDLCRQLRRHNEAKQWYQRAIDAPAKTKYLQSMQLEAKQKMDSL
jgi:tetratricopeptide (TPR) repeat protein